MAERLIDFLTAGGDMTQVHNQWRPFGDDGGMATETTIGGEGISTAKKAR